jgi:hypothetical protein
MATLQAINFGTGFAASSAGRKSKRVDGEAIADHITDVVGGDAVILSSKHLEVLEFMVSKFKSHSPSVALDKHVLLGLEVIQSTCACARMIFASFAPLKSIHHLLHASTDLSSLLLLMRVPGTTRGAGWGCALCFPWVRGTPSQGLFKGRYKNACRQGHQAVLSRFATHSRCLRSLLEIRVKMYESLKP